MYLAEGSGSYTVVVLVQKWFALFVLIQMSTSLQKELSSKVEKLSKEVDIYMRRKEVNHL